MRARALDTVYDIDRHGSPELEGHRVPEINNIAGYDERGRQSHRCELNTRKTSLGTPANFAGSRLRLLNWVAQAQSPRLGT